MMEVSNDECDTDSRSIFSDGNGSNASLQHSPVHWPLSPDMIPPTPLGASQKKRRNRINKQKKKTTPSLTGPSPLARKKKRQRDSKKQKRMDESALASSSTTTGTSGEDVHDPEIIHPPGTGSGTAAIDDGVEAATTHQDSPASPLAHPVEMGCKKRLFDHGPSAKRIQGMHSDTSKKEIAELNEKIDELEDAKDELQEDLKFKDNEYRELYRQYTNLTYNSAIRDEHHKRCTHLRLSGQVSAYTSRQVSESIFSQTFYEPDPDIDNIFVPYITVELRGHLKKGKQANIYMAKHGRNSYCCKEYFDEGKCMMAHHEFQVLSCLNAQYTPYPIGISLSNRKPGLVTSIHQIDDFFCHNLGDFLSADAYRPLRGEEWANVAVTLGMHLDDVFNKGFLWNNLRAEHVVVESAEGEMKLFLVNWSRSCKIESAKVLTARQVRSIQEEDVAPEVLRRKKPFSVASDIFAYGSLCLKILKFCCVHDIHHSTFSAMETFAMRCVSPVVADRPERGPGGYLDSLATFVV